jgi:hypothetical protein
MIPVVMLYCGDASAVLVVEVLTCVCRSSSLVVQVRALFCCRDLCGHGLRVIMLHLTFICIQYRLSPVKTCWTDPSRPMPV